MDPIVIIGTGLAGYGVARELRKHDADTPLVLMTRDDGASYYKPDLSEAFTNENQPDDLIKKDAETQGTALDAEVLTHVQVESIDPQGRVVRHSDGEQAFSQLVLACGAQPVEVPLAGDAGSAVYQVNNLTDYRGLRKALEKADTVAIMGAGLIGCEFANDLSNIGKTVHNIDPIAWPLKRFVPEVLGRALEKALADNGVNWHLDATVDGIAHSGDGLRLSLSDDSHVDADVVLSAIGLAPDMALAESAGLKTDRGIVVDRYLRTSHENIYALGDCAEVEGHTLPFVMPLMNAARALGSTLAGEPTQVRYPVMPVIVKTPACPVIVYPPQDNGGEWRIEGDAPDIEARYEAADGSLLGFALSGEATGKRRDYIKQAPPVLG